MIKSLSLKAAINDAVQVFQFDQWLRFHYIVEKEDGTLFVEIPEEVMQRIKSEYPRLHSLAEVMNDHSITQQSSHDAVCAHIASNLDGEKYDPSVIPRVFDAPQFKIDMYVFNIWVKMHESILEQEGLFFSDWEQSFNEWKELDEVKEYLAKLHNTDPESPSCGTVQ
jgi:hypothetical protein